MEPFWTAFKIQSFAEDLLGRRRPMTFGGRKGGNQSSRHRLD
jgi:hypothetical protein